MAGMIISEEVPDSINGQAKDDWRDPPGPMRSYKLELEFRDGAFRPWAGQIDYPP